VQTAYEVREHLYALMPYWSTFGGVTHVEANEAFVSDVGALLQVLLTPPGARPDAERSRLFTFATTISQSPFYSRLVFRQIVEEADFLGDEALLRAIGGLKQTDMAENMDLLARLAAAIARRDPLDQRLLDTVRRHLMAALHAPMPRADLSDHVTRAFGDVGMPVPDWAWVTRRDVGN
jgi:hypothetical protein